MSKTRETTILHDPDGAESGDPSPWVSRC
jgi:hypothetical protein